MLRMKFAGIGSYVPERVVTNDDLEKMMDTSDEWIRQRTGIEERHWVSEGENNSDLALKASELAIADAGIDKDDIDLIIFATLSSEMYFPGTGAILQHKLGLKEVPAIDVRAQCSGFLYGLSVANGMITSGMYKHVLLVGSEVQSRGLLKETAGRDVAVIFGDGAGAAVLEPTENENEGLIDIMLGGDGKYAGDLAVRSMGSRWDGFMTDEQLENNIHYPYMAGSKVFKHAIVRMPKSVKAVCERNGITPKDVDLLIAHQANLRINEILGRALEIEDKMFNNIQKYGNTTAATIPLCLDDARKAGRWKKGDLIALTAFGSGFTWGSALVRM